MDLFSMIFALKQSRKARDAIYQTESQDGFVVYTNSGADGIPVKRFIATRDYDLDSYSGIVVRRLGKNLLNPDPNAYDIGYNISSGASGDPPIGALKQADQYATLAEYLPVMPSTDYVISGGVVSNTAYNAVAFYDAYKVCLGRMSSKGSGVQFTTPYNCYFIKYSVSTSRVQDLAEYRAMLEVGTEPSVYEAYSKTDYIVDFGYEYGGVDYASVNVVDGTVIQHDSEIILNFQPVEITTRLGANYFYVVCGGDDTSSGDVTSISMTYRLDPTLAYRSIKDAIVAAGI